MIDVTLSMNRSVSTSVSLTVMSRAPESKCLPSTVKTVERGQSSWVRW